MTRTRSLLSGQEAADHEPQDEGQVPESTDENQFLEQEDLEEQYWEDEPALPRAQWVAPALAISVALAWTGFFAWVNQAQILRGGTPAQWVDWIGQWSLPLILLVGLYLVFMRNSRREALRFGKAARSLAHESNQLESRLQVVNRELALARNFIEAQSRDLESLGRTASERLSGQADRLHTLIHTNSEQVDIIGRVSESAVSNMETLRDQLPVVANSARDVSNQFGSAGQMAKEQADAIVAAYERLHDFGERSEGHVASLQKSVEEVLSAFNTDLDTIEDQASRRFATLRRENEQFRADLAESEEHVFDAIATRSEALTRQLANDVDAMRKREATAAAAMRERLVALRVEGEKLVAKMDDGQAEATNKWTATISALEERMKQVLEGVIKLDETAMANARSRLVALTEEAEKVDHRLAESMTTFETDFGQRRAAHEEAQNAAIAALEERVAAFDERMSERQEEHLAHISGLAERGEALASRLNTLDAELGRLGSQSADASTRVTEAAEALGTRLSENRAVLSDSSDMIARLTNDSVRLLEIIRSSADHSEGALTEAIGKAEGRLSAFSDNARALHDLIADTEQKGSSIAAQLEAAKSSGSASLEQLEALEGQLETVTSETEKLAERTSNELREAIEMLSAASADVLENLRGDHAQGITELAESLAEASREKLATSMRRYAEETLAELDKATERADGAGRETAAMLSTQIAEVNQLAANLEHRVQYARERAEEQIDHDFARRSALITEALNSSAIDIAKAFDNDIGDTQWAHYLRGDRGIFTRRAVRLLDKQDARQVSAVYAEDEEFRDVVNRYIHDFEAMLRGILSTRDGNAMAVTLLSSDMGKLYVALAQAIDRLRD